MKILLVTIVFFGLAVLFMALALNFAKYKKRKSACCGGGNCDISSRSKTCDKNHEISVPKF